MNGSNFLAFLKKIFGQCATCSYQSNHFDYFCYILWEDAKATRCLLADVAMPASRSLFERRNGATTSYSICSNLFSTICVLDHQYHWYPHGSGASIICDISDLNSSSFASSAALLHSRTRVSLPLMTSFTEHSTFGSGLSASSIALKDLPFALMYSMAVIIVCLMPAPPLSLLALKSQEEPTIIGGSRGWIRWVPHREKYGRRQS